MALSTGACLLFHPLPLLLDVLEEVPLDVVEANLWLSLPSSSRSSLRLVSHRSQRLADALQSSAVVCLGPAEEAEEDEARSAEHIITPWAAYLARLPHLSSLELLNWDSEADLQLAMLHFGAAARSRVVSLLLSGSALSLGTACAMRLAFPHLQKLHLDAPRVELETGPLAVEGALFLPLHDLPLLELCVGSCGSCDALVAFAPAALASLRGLTQLQRLTLYLDDLLPEHMPLFAAFSHLQHLSLDCNAPSFTAADAAPLFALTRLTSLVLAVRPDDGASVLSPAALHAAPAPAPSLGDLVGLRCLDMGQHFVADDGAFEQIRRLTRLTELADCRIALTQPRPGSLPLLQQLTLNWTRPTALLQALLPLLPLASLTALNGQYPWLALDVEGDDDGDDARRQVAALKAALQLLASAPRLPAPTDLALGCRAVGPGAHSLSGQLSFAHVVEGLGAWLLPLTTLRLYDVKMDTFGGRALGAALPALRYLVLSFGMSPPDVQSGAGQHVTDLAEQMTVLERLDVLGLAGGHWRQSAWLGVAAVRAAPLLLVVGRDAAPDATMRGVCREVQEEAFGRQNITWAVCPASCEDGYDLL